MAAYRPNLNRGIAEDSLKSFSMGSLQNNETGPGFRTDT